MGSRAVTLSSGGGAMPNRGVAALLFHHVGLPRPGTDPSLTVQPNRFERFIRVLERLGYNGVPARSWSAALSGRASLPRRPILITFDDGYADLTEFALPALQRVGWGSTVFVAASTVGARSAWDEPRVTPHRIMAADDIREWAERGVEFGAHGATHCDLTRVDSNRLRAEVLDARDALAALLGQSVTAFAYPYGNYNDEVRTLVRSSFELAFGLEEGLNGPETDRTRLRRTMIQSSDTMIDVVLRAALGRSLLEPVRAHMRLRDRARRLGRPIRRAVGRKPLQSGPPSARR